MSIKSALKTLALLLAVTLNQNTFAAGYFGIGGGTTNWTLKPYLGAYELRTGDTLDVLIGDRGNRTAIEFEYSYSSHDWNGVSNAAHSVRNFMMAGLGFLPVNQTLELYGKLGFDLWRTTVEYAGQTFQGTTGVSAVFGLGANFNITQTFSLRAEYKRMEGIGDGVDEGDIGQTTAMIILRP